MTLEEMRQAAQEFHTRGDAVGMYRYLCDRVARAADSREEGSARLLLADMMIRWQLGTPRTIAAELSRARALLRPFPDELADCLFLELVWRVVESDAAGTAELLAAYEKLCRRYPDRPGVQRWRGRISAWLARLDRARGDLRGAVTHLQRSLCEYAQYEPDPGAREQLIRMSKLTLAQLALQAGELQQARMLLDECEGSTISRLWETARACTEVEYALQAGNPERMQFWLRVARSWATPQGEASTLLTLAQAKVAYALGEVEKARLLTSEARRLAAQSKQDQLMPEIRAFFRLLTTGVGTGRLAEGGIPRAEASVRMAAAGDDTRHGRRRHH